MRIRWKEAALVFVSVFLTLLVIEVLLRITSLATELPWQEGDQAQGFKFVPNQAGTTVIGKWGDKKARFHINSDGWNAIRDYSPQRVSGTNRIAVIGDSYVLALNVDPPAAMSAVLEKALLGRGLKVEVYPFGNWSASASHYLAIMRYVRQRFSPDLYIINIVHGDMSESLVTPERAIYFSIRETEDSFEEVPPQFYRPYRLKRLMGHFALARYLYQNLEIGRIFNRTSRYSPGKFEANIRVEDMIDNVHARRLTEYIFNKYLQEVGEDRKKLLIVMDSVREAIYQGIYPNTTAPFQYNKVFNEACQELSLNCLDLTDAFWSDFQLNKQRFNATNDGHWNEYGQGVVAKAVEEYLLRNDLAGNR